MISSGSSESEDFGDFLTPENWRWKAVDLSPPVPDEGCLNHYYSKMRTLGDRHIAKADYVLYVWGFRASYAKPGLLNDKGEIRQDFFQPIPKIPTHMMLAAVKRNMIEHGIDPHESYPKYRFPEYRAPQEEWAVDILVHLCLGALDLTELIKAEYNFESVEEIDRMQKANLDKADALDRRWGHLFWNKNYPPMPRKFKDKKRGYVLDCPTEKDWKCPLYRDLVQRKMIKPCVDEYGNFQIPGKYKRSKSSSSQRIQKAEQKENSLFSFGFLPSKSKRRRKAKSKVSK